MDSLEIFKSYCRRDVHSFFSPHSKFVPQAGTWGLHGIVDVPGPPGDYVFFVTYGQTQGNHEFEESISETGILSWQSQPRQGFKDRRIQDFLKHKEDINSIHLFFRADQRDDYTYFGRLRFSEYDPEKEFPVHIKWQILDWPPPAHIRATVVRCA